MKRAIAVVPSGLLRVRLWLLQQPFFTSTLLPAMPRRVRWALRTMYFAPLDLFERVLGGRDELTPPATEIFTGGVNDFRAGSERQLKIFREFAGLTPNSRVLDIGSGNGRVAVAMIGYLGEAGSYDGLDIVESGIAWCNERIASKYPNFRFTLADIYNREYNPTGHFKASEYRFPYPDDQFDLVVLVSVFTHMLPADMEQYAREIARVLAPGGRCLATYFLVNDDSRARMDAGESPLRFKHHVPPYWTVNTKVPELSVGYDEDYVRGLYGGLFADTVIHHGGWSQERTSASQDRLGEQDMVVATKAS